MSYVEFIHVLFLAGILSFSIFLILSKNPVHSVLLLILIFFFSACISILFGSDFLGILFIVVYVGAIAVLFLFVVMMLNLKTAKILLHEFYIIFFTIFFIFLLFLFLIFSFDFSSIFQKNLIQNNIFDNVLDSFFNIDIFGQCLYNYFLPCFLISGILLLVALLGAITLTLRYRSSRKNQLPYKQLSRTSSFLSYFGNTYFRF